MERTNRVDTYTFRVMQAGARIFDAQLTQPDVSFVHANELSQLLAQQLLIVRLLSLLENVRFVVVRRFFESETMQGASRQDGHLYWHGQLRGEGVFPQLQN